MEITSSKVAEKKPISIISCAHDKEYAISVRQRH